MPMPVPPAPDVGTYCYLFTWETPAFGGILGSCHALEIPFVFGTVHNPAVHAFSGGGDEAFALSMIMGDAWTSHARLGAPSHRMRTGSIERPAGLVTVGQTAPPDDGARSVAGQRWD